MRETNRPPASAPAHPLWAALLHYRIGPADAAVAFEARLARANGWSPAKAAGVVEEYKRFCFLAATCGHEVTPSDAVDQAWHLHLTYTHDYWERFCPEVLGRPLHHVPTTGSTAAAHRHFDAYARTLAGYEAVFGQCPPPDVWPSAARMLFDDPRARRVHPRDVFVFSRRAIGFAVAAIPGAALAWILLH
jgi:hypothetical protein